MEITKRMEQYAQMARDCNARSGPLSDYMSGYYTGAIDVQAIIAGSNEAFELRDKLSAEIRGMTASCKVRAA